MGRGLSTAFKEAMGASVVMVAFFAEFEFDGTTTRLWTGEGDITVDLGTGSAAWTGSSVLGGFEFSGETDKVESRSCAFYLRGLDGSYYSTAIATDYRGRPARLWFAIVNSAGNTVLYSYLLEEMRMDTLTMQDDGNDITLILRCESRLVDMFRPRRVPMSSFWHHRTYPSDDFYEFVPRLQSFELPWGTKR